ncbi:hypothetical protein GGD54_000048 [Rhizobium tropici]|uniref:Uncharacterized protein n=1 Tax=Rhizobium tropici TaxID=398 RepID=A0ABR6QTC2_RHITR|nr:hypothetical protein [Rhizobium tropici]MBB5590611.1 hypothetical protein [Rhizobium tropici]MBB6490180.1 hypothetical protein [Rhizobium tropici]
MALRQCDFGFDVHCLLQERVETHSAIYTSCLDPCLLSWHLSRHPTPSR